MLSSVGHQIDSEWRLEQIQHTLTVLASGSEFLDGEEFNSASSYRLDVNKEEKDPNYFCTGRLSG